MIEARNLTKSYGDEVAVHDLTFTVRPGTVTGATLFGLLLVVPPLGFFLPDSWQENALPYLPNYAGAALSSISRQPDLLSPVGDAIVLLAWALVPLAAAAVFLVRRDA